MIQKPELPKDTDTHYFYHSPIYDHYKKVKVIERCECCDHKTGEHFEKRGVKVIKWEIKKGKKDMQYHLNQMWYEQMMRRVKVPSLLDNIKGKKGNIIRFTKQKVKDEKET